MRPCTSISPREPYSSKRASSLMPELDMVGCAELVVSLARRATYDGRRWADQAIIDAATTQVLPRKV